jgi:hypothetical protein
MSGMVLGSNTLSHWKLQQHQQLATISLPHAAHHTWCSSQQYHPAGRLCECKAGFSALGLQWCTHCSQLLVALPQQLAMNCLTPAA